VLRVSAASERAGVPSVALVSEGFIGQAKNTAASIGLPGLPLAMIPSHPDVQSDDELARNVAQTTLGQVVIGLTGETAAVGAVSEPDPDVPVFEGSFDEVNRFFYENQWSDGLPIVPPTRARIEAFLAFTPLAPDHVLGTALPDNRAATVWSVAVNGVMAGCRPEYMPILVALTQAMVDPKYGVEHSGNTPGAETQIVLNGPLIKELGFNYEQGAMRDGVQANTSIGRFWRLMLRNLAGFLLHGNDKGTFGGTWRVVLAENEDVVKEIGWPTVAQDAGVAAGANAVTIARYTGAHVITSVFGRSAEECVPYLADALTKYTGWELIFTVGMTTGTFRPLLVLSPIIARTIASSGWTKEKLQQALFEQVRIPARLFESYLSTWTNLVPGRRSLYDMVKLGKAPKIYGESRDPDRLVPIVLKPRDIMIAVSGDPLRTNCYSLTHNGMLGYPTTVEIALPEDWRGKLRAAQGD
jgi:hypothetical protein